MKNKITKIITIIMAIAMIAGTINPLRVEAASKKKPKLNKKTVTLIMSNRRKTPMTILKVKNAKTKKIKWKSSNKNVIRIKKSGRYGIKITAKKAGKAKITCKTAGKKLTCKVIVKDKRKTDNKKPKCEHEWAEKWATFELEGDYGPDARACNCGVFNNEEEFKLHLFHLGVYRGTMNTTKMHDETGIHGTRSRGTNSIEVHDNITHIMIKREYIEYYYCTKCNLTIGGAWDHPQQS